MEDDNAVQVTLSIDRAGEPISGWLESPSALRRPFVGILDLVGLLERARTGAAGGGGGD
jgi:hypothetical protein